MGVSWAWHRGRWTRGRFELSLLGFSAGAELRVQHSLLLDSAAGHRPAREMVEGPGCTVNGEKIRARVLPGQAVTDVRGRALQSPQGPGSSLAAPVAEVSFQVSYRSDWLWRCGRDGIKTQLGFQNP